MPPDVKSWTTFFTNKFEKSQKNKPYKVFSRFRTDLSLVGLNCFLYMPYKAVVLRLFESGNISHQQAEKLLEAGSADVMERASLTGKAKRWQLDGKGTESFGTLLEKVEYNRQHEYLTESREKEDVAYLTQLKKEYGLD